MRISVNKDDPGYQNHQALTAAKAKVEFFLDGEPVADVTEADDVIGYVKIGSDEKRLRGVVEIRIAQQEPEPEVAPEPEYEAQPEPVEADVDGE